MIKNSIATHFKNSLVGMIRAVEDDALFTVTGVVVESLALVLRTGGKLLVAGNGGSAGDAQHLAAEIVGRYKAERPGWAAIALTTDTSALTAIANDYGYDQVFARQVEGLGRPGDMLWGLTTSGCSPNILNALSLARAKGLVTVGFTGLRGTAMAAHCDHLLLAPSDDTPVVQQIHMMIGHAICDAVEKELIATHK